MTAHILILGASGMLGHMVEHVLASAGFAVRGVTRAEFDATGPVLPLFKGSEEGRDPHYIVNCIGITSRHIDDCDPASVARAIRVNSEFPHALAAIAGEHGVRVIHMSTDGVFSGASSDPYDESSAPDCTDTYGRTKSLGESVASNVLNVRTSIVGPSPVKREGLWEWVAAQPDGATVQGYTNHVWHGVTTRQFAEFVVRVIREDRFDALRATSHILHLAPNAPCTKFDLLCAMRDALGKRIAIEPAEHAQPIRRVLTTRSGALRSMLGAPHPIASAMRAYTVVV